MSSIPDFIHPQVRSSTVLVISPTPSHPQNAGNRVRIHHLLASLKSLGYKVHLFVVDKESNSNHVAKKADVAAMEAAWDGVTYLEDRPDLPTQGTARRFSLRSLRRIVIDDEAWLKMHRLRAKKKILADRIGRLRQRVRRATPEGEGGIIGQIDSWYNFSIDRHLQQLQQREKFDTVIVEYVFMSAALNNFSPKVLKIIDAHDVFSDRNKQYSDRGLVETFFSVDREEECAGLNRADAVIAIQDKEREIFRSMISKPVVTVGHTVQVSDPVRLGFVRKNILFLGAANIGNIDGIQWFIREVMPLLRNSVEDICLYVAGRVSDAIERHDNVISLGELDDLDVVYAHADVVVNPVSLGSGLKIKCIEALGYGKALVTSPHASEGLQWAEYRPYIQAEGAQQFHDAIVNLFGNTELYNEFSQRAHKFCRWYNRQTVNALEQLLNSASPGRMPVAGVAARQATKAMTKQVNPPRFIIISFARSGSTTLAELMSAHPDMTCLLEPFNKEHGVKWGKEHFRERLLRGEDLEQLVEEILLRYNGFKHLVGQLSVAQNRSLFKFDGAKRIFLWRRNHLQRLVSNHISGISGEWRSDTNKIMVTRFPPIQIDRLAAQLDRQKERVSACRAFCSEYGCHEIVYEDFFDSHGSVDDRLNRLYHLFDYLGVDRGDGVSASDVSVMERLLRPDQRKLNSSSTYQLIPNIEEVERRLGSAENGYLFR